MFKKYSYALVFLSSNDSGKSRVWIGGVPGISNQVLRSLMFFVVILWIVEMYSNSQKPEAPEVYK